jgi:hypothetical protein
MAASDYLFEVLPVRVLVLKRPTAAPGDPDPVEVRLLQQSEHLLEITVIDVSQHIFSSALNLLPHQVRSAFQASICPPSDRMNENSPARPIAAHPSA